MVPDVADEQVVLGVKSDTVRRSQLSFIADPPSPLKPATPVPAIVIITRVFMSTFHRVIVALDDEEITLVLNRVRGVCLVKRLWRCRRQRIRADHFPLWWSSSSFLNPNDECVDYRDRKSRGRAIRTNHQAVRIVYLLVGETRRSVAGDC